MKLVPMLIKIRMILNNNILQLISSGSDVQALAVLSVVAFAVLLPLTFWKRSNCFTVGYGATIAGLAGTLFVVETNVVTKTLLALCILHGTRLALFLLYRGLSVAKIEKQTEKFDRLPIVLSVPLSAFLGILYTIMASPVLFIVRESEESSSKIVPGLLLAAFGVSIEAIADQHKSVVKRRASASYDHHTFVGPTGGLYGIVRHPNYSGEIMFWAGLLVAGLPTYTSRFRFLVALCGFLCIFWIMCVSTKQLDRKQEEKYRGQALFEDWKQNVPSRLVDFF